LHFSFLVLFFAGMKAKTVKRVDWSPKKRVIAITLRKEGYSYREIASKMGHGVTPSGIRKLFVRFQETGSVENQAGRGRKRLTTPTTDRQISRLALGKRQTSSGDINKDLQQVGVKVSDRTIRQRLVAAGLRARIPRKKPFLNVLQRQKRVAWAKQHVTWTAEQLEQSNLE